MFVGFADIHDITIEKRPIKPHRSIQVREVAGEWAHGCPLGVPLLERLAEDSLFESDARLREEALHFSVNTYLGAEDVARVADPKEDILV
jgi:hypothetical protein